MQGLKRELEKRGLGFVISREPGGTALGEEVRRLLLKVDGQAPVPRAEALLYQADRAQHVETLIKPALKEGKWVISDRFAASSIAFQTGGRAIEPAAITWLNEFSTGGLKPDLYVLLDLTVEESLNRLSRRGEDIDRFEREKADFHERVRQSYLTMAKAAPQDWLILNAAEKPEALLEKLIAALKGKTWLA